MNEEGNTEEQGMGERATVGFIDDYTGEEFGVEVYLHWMGPVEDVYAIAQMCRLLGYRSSDDPSYMSERFAFVAGCACGAEDGLSVGLCPLGRGDDSNHGHYTLGDDWAIVKWTHEGEDGTERTEEGIVPVACVADGTVGKTMTLINERLPERARIPRAILEGYVKGMRTFEQAREDVDVHRRSIRGF